MFLWGQIPDYRDESEEDELDTASDKDFIFTDIFILIGMIAAAAFSIYIGCKLWVLFF